MPTKSIDRLMFIQGGRCFFCNNPLLKSEASVEHLFASSNGGTNRDDNCVACCKSINSLLGSMSLKEKFQVVLNQKGQFKCPNSSCHVKAPTVLNNLSSGIEKEELWLDVPDKDKDKEISLIVANLKQRGTSKPRTINALTNTIASIFKKDLSEQDLSLLVNSLKLTGKIIVKNNDVSYNI